MLLNNSSSFDDFTPDQVSDPGTFSADDALKPGSVFIIPLDAPVPSELSEIPVPAGTLYERLVNIGSSAESSNFAFAPLSGAELFHLDRAWRLLQSAKRVYALFDVPGARYDVLFTQAVKTIGLRRVEWPAVSEAMLSASRTAQRTHDSTPWLEKKPLAPTATRGLPATAQIDDSPLPTPEEEAD